MRSASFAPRIRVEAKAVSPVVTRKLRRVGFCMAPILAIYGIRGKRRAFVIYRAQLITRFESPQGYNREPICTPNRMATSWKRGRLLKTIRIRLIASAALFLASHAEAQSQNALDLLPVPTVVRLGVGRLTVDQSFSIALTGVRDAMLERGVHRFVAELSRETGMLLKQETFDLPSPTLLIHAVHSSERV